MTRSQDAISSSLTFCDCHLQLLCYVFLEVPMPKVLTPHSHHLQELALHSPSNPANVGRLFSIIEPISTVSIRASRLLVLLSFMIFILPSSKSKHLAATSPYSKIPRTPRIIREIPYGSRSNSPPPSPSPLPRPLPLSRRALTPPLRAQIPGLSVIIPPSSIRTLELNREDMKQIAFLDEGYVACHFQSDSREVCSF